MTDLHVANAFTYPHLSYYGWKEGSRFWVWTLHWDVERDPARYNFFCKLAPAQNVKVGYSCQATKCVCVSVHEHAVCNET